MTAARGLGEERDQQAGTRFQAQERREKYKE